MSPEAWEKRQTAHFDARAEDYRDLYERETPFHQAVTQGLLDGLQIAPGMKVLDLGCGLGRLTRPLLRAGCQVTGLDSSPRLLEHLRARLQEETLDTGFTPLLANAEAFDLPGAFDRVVGRGLLHHLAHPDEALRRSCLALVTGGQALFVDPNPLQPAWLPFVLLHPTLSLSLERHVWRGWPWKVKGWFQAAGFQDIQQSTTGFLPGGLSRDWDQRLASASATRCLGLYLVTRGVR